MQVFSSTLIEQFCLNAFFTNEIFNSNIQQFRLLYSIKEHYLKSSMQIYRILSPAECTVQGIVCFSTVEIIWLFCSDSVIFLQFFIYLDFSGFLNIYSFIFDSTVS